MTVKELRDALEALPPEAHICASVKMKRDAPETDALGGRFEIESALRDRFGVINLYCRQSSGHVDLADMERTIEEVGLEKAPFANRVPPATWPPKLTFKDTHPEAG